MDIPPRSPVLQIAVTSSKFSITPCSLSTCHVSDKWMLNLPRGIFTLSGISFEGEGVDRYFCKSIGESQRIISQASVRPPISMSRKHFQLAKYFGRSSLGWWMWELRWEMERHIYKLDCDSLTIGDRRCRSLPFFVQHRGSQKLKGKKSVKLVASLRWTQGAPVGRFRDHHSRDFNLPLFHGVHQDPSQI